MYDHDIQAGSFDIKNHKIVLDDYYEYPSMFGDIVKKFYENVFLDRGFKVRIDVLIIYDANKLFINLESMEEQNRNSICQIVLAVVITAIVVGGGMYLWQSTKTTVETPTEKVSDTQSVQTTKPKVKEMVETKTTTPTIKQGYSYDSPQWKLFTSDIKTKTGEIVDSFYAPESPSDDNVIFISTSGDTTGKWPDTIKSTNKIYSYNIKTGELSKLYEEHKNRILRTMGIEGSKLIIMYDLIDNSPGPCFSVWADWHDFGYIDVENPSTLRPYTVPDYQVEKGNEEQKKCKAKIGL